jgi:endoglucanase
MKVMLFTILSIFLAVSCGKDPQPQPEHVKLSADKTALEFAAEGGEQTVTVTASEKLYIVSDMWLTAKQGTKSEDHKILVTFTASANDKAEERVVKVSLVAGDEKVYVDVTQAAAEKKDEPGGDDPILPDDNGSVAWQMLEKFGLGWNLGNQMDAFYNGVSGETAWGNPKATQTTFNKVKAAGFTTVRIPVTWLGHIGEAPEYKIDEAWLNRVAELVGYAENAGLNAVINMHHDGGDSKYWLNIKGAANNAEIQAQVLAQIEAMWTQIAEKFKDKGDFLVFEAFNEIHDGGWGWGTNREDGGKQYKCLNEWNQKFVDAVRATGGNNATRILGIPAYCTNVDIAIENFVMPEDAAENRLMLSVHSYDPYDYALSATKSEWGHTADMSKKVSGDNELQIRTMFEKIYVNFIEKGIPVYMGEFGCVNRATEREQAFQQYYLKYFTKAAKEYGVPCFIWDNGADGAGNECHAFIDHATGEYSSAGAEAAIRAMTTAYRSDYSLEDIYNQAPIF